MTNKQFKWLVAGAFAAPLFIAALIRNVEQPAPLRELRQADAEAPVDCPALRSAIQEQQAKIDYVKSAIAADRTLAADANLSTKLNQTEFANTLALGEYTRRCQSR